MAIGPSLTFPARLLAKYLIRRATTVSAAVLTADTEKQFARNSYIILVLEAPAGIRDTVKAMALASDEPGQKQLLAILVVFDALTPSDQGAFISAFKGFATLATQGSMDVYRDHTWDDGHIPPRQEP